MRRLPKNAFLERWKAEHVCNQANAHMLSIQGCELYRVRKDGPINAPYWIVEQVI